EDREGGWRLWQQNIKHAYVITVEPSFISKDVRRLGSMTTGCDSITSSARGVRLNTRPTTQTRRSGACNRR
ncbi:hypothetical protein P9C02_00005, partial [Bacillus paralicheniformis]|uniref:hypothetical protein n=1 Tax=Bacillus paralicheniformis TaxID=1648923 RepID=UPI002DB607B3